MEIRPEEFTLFSDWFGSALKTFVIAVPASAFLAIIVCYVISAARRGPVEAFYAVAGVIASAIGKDLPATSARRILAVARLTVKEAIRRRLIVAFIIFVIAFLFAGWFLDPRSDDPAHLYLSFVLTTTNYLVIVLAISLATASIPSDIKSKTIYTIVTKPVRASEIVVGRVLGFAAVISVLLVAMCAISYLFVNRGMRHEHQVNEESVIVSPVAEGSGAGGGSEGLTTSDSYHRHSFKVNPQGVGVTDKVRGHRHAVARDVANPSSYLVGEPEGALEARVPIYGQLRFLDREGNPADKGVNVGKEWEYRSYIEGRSLATAIWTFEGITPADFREGNLPIAMTLGVFRTHKGDIETRVRGVVILSSVNPRKPLQCEPIGFESQEFSTQQLRIPRKLRPVGEDGATGREIDLFDDLVHEGKLEIWLRCDDPGQFFGVAQADLSLEAPNASFEWNFVKAYISIWFQVLIVVCMGVTFSTFVNSPVAIMASVCNILLGFFGGFVSELRTGEAFGGGPIEATIRLARQDNLVKPLEVDLGVVAVRIVKFLDNALLSVMDAMTWVLPDFSSLGRATEYVAYNFNYYDSLLARQSLSTLVYVAGILIVGYFFLKTREIAA
ncbi:MAG: ABC transporter permease [Planctomycetes bacterium]|nr:ABC transporter permease [Planctomycetota bacterium]